MDLDARSGSDPPPDGISPGTAGQIKTPASPVAAPGATSASSPSTPSFVIGARGPVLESPTASKTSRKRAGAILNDSLAAAVEIYAKNTADELRALLHQRDEQLRQVQATLAMVVRSNETLAKTNATISVNAGSSEHFPRLPQGPSPGSTATGVNAALNVSNSAPAPLGSFTFWAHAHQTAQPSFAQRASAAKDLPLRNLDAERHARALSLVPLSAAARRQRKVRNATPASAYDQCYVKLASKRISKLKEDLAFIGVRVDLIHNIALPTEYSAELTFLKDRKEELFGSLRKCGIPILHNFQSARAHGSNASAEQKARVLTQYRERMAVQIMSAHNNGSRGLAEYLRGLVKEIDEPEMTATTTASSSQTKSTAAPPEPQAGQKDQTPTSSGSSASPAARTLPKGRLRAA